MNPLTFQAQMSGVSAYIRGTSVEMGINGPGGFEGVDTLLSPLLPGMHYQSTTKYFGFVANPQMNNWANFDGDFFTPGTPENGWGIEFGNTGGTVGASNNCYDDLNFTGNTRVQIPGAITNYSHISNCYSTDWEGDDTIAGTNLHFKINYFLQQSDLFYTTTVSIKNNTSATIPLLYYYRSLDPDNNATLSFNYNTQNTIEDQPGSGSSCNIACVSATQQVPNASYVGLAAVGADFRVTYGGFSNRSGSDIWNGTALTQAVGSTNNGDEAISLAYKIQNFLPGTTRTFKFVTILNAADKTKALDNLLYLSYPGSSNLPPAICTVGMDTIMACGGSVPISIVGPTTGNYTWSWTPTSYLSSVNTSSTLASPLVPTIYTLTGTPTSICTSTIPLVYQFLVKPMAALATTITANTPLCAGNTLSLTANGGAYYSWTGPGGYTSAAQSPTIANVSPGNAGVYTAVITTTTGCTGTATVDVSLGSTPSPTLGSNAPICAGNTLSLTATATTSYSWAGPGGYTSNVQNPVIPSVMSSGVYTLTSPGTICPSIVTISVTILSPGTMTLSSNSPVCSGNSINLTANTTASTYTWTGPGGYTSITQNPIIPSASSSGIYTLTIGTGTCISVNTTTVTVIPMTTSTLSSNSPICAGSTLSLTSTGTATTFTWTGPGGFSSNLQNPIRSSLLSSGVYTLSTGTGSCLTINTISITVLPAGPIPLSPLPVVCNNGNINLVSPAGGTQYVWSGPNAFTSSLQNPVITNAATVNQGVYSVSVTASGCMNTGTVNVTVYNPLSFIDVPTNVTLCATKTAYLSTSGGLGGSGSYLYQWSPVTNLANPNAPGTVVTGLSTTIYTLTLSDANCPVTLTPTTAVTVSVNPIPVITFTTNKARGCEPFCTDLVSTSNPPSANCSWKFSKNLSTTLCNAPTFCFPIHGVYDASLTVTDVNGCVDSVRQSAFITVDPKPLPDFSWFPINPTILMNQVNYTDLSTVGLPIKRWSWNFGDNFVPFAEDTSSLQNPSHDYSYPTSYQVSLAVENVFGCRDTVTKIMVVEDDFALFIPNAFSPGKSDGVNDSFSVKGMGFSAESFEMAIYDRSGSVLFKTNDINKGWDGTTKSGAKVPQDVYVYKIKVKDNKNRVRSFLGHVTLL